MFGSSFEASPKPEKPKVSKIASNKPIATPVNKGLRRQKTTVDKPIVKPVNKEAFIFGSVLQNES